MIGRVENTDRLAEAPIFAELPPDTLGEIAERSRLVVVAAGSDVIRQGDEADAVMVLISGRLRVFVRSPDGGESAVADIGPGELVGEMALLSSAQRSATVRAVRDSRLIAVDRATFDKLVVTDARAAVGMARLLASRLERANTGRRSSPRRRTLAIVPSSAKAADATEQLVAALERAVDTSCVRSVDVADVDEASLGDWLNRAELAADVLVYVGDSSRTPWTVRCLRQADHLVVVDDPSADLDGRFVETLVGATTGPVSPSLDVVVVNPSTAESATGGSRWVEAPLSLRIHQVRDGDRSDLDRVVRSLTHADVSLVLSGGGARGMTHVGVIRAFEEAGVPIDVVGGTSFGGIVAGYLAMGLDWRAIRDELWRTVGKPGAPVDLTLPFVALSKGRRLMEVLTSSFGDVAIENLWRRMFCVSSNLSTGRPLAHTHGSLRMALRASVAIPGVFPPVATPDGELLVDGGVMNNLPIDVMLSFADGGPLVAVNLRSDVVLELADLPDDGVISGWRAAMARLTPRRDTHGLPGLADVLLRSADTGASLAARVLEPRADYVMHPPVEGYGLLEFGALDELIESGYAYANTMLERWADEDRALLRVDGAPRPHAR